jgi:uncharacterized membrane protein
MREVLAIAIAVAALLVVLGIALGRVNSTFVARPVRITPARVAIALVLVVALALALHAL